jgi:hypothetical protein
MYNIPFNTRLINIISQYLPFVKRVSYKQTNNVYEDTTPKGYASIGQFDVPSTEESGDLYAPWGLNFVYRIIFWIVDMLQWVVAFIKYPGVLPPLP